MTNISYVHGLGRIPSDEFADRGRGLSSSNYLPYNSLTVGEAYLALQLDRMKMLSRFYPESKELKQSVVMLGNALNAGISRGVSFIGAVPNELQDLARIITRASNLNQPAVRGGIMGRSSIYQGIGEVGDGVDAARRLKICVARKGANPNAEKPKPNSSRSVLEAWAKRQQAEAECKLRLEFEDLLNEKVSGLGHHMLYKSLDASFLDIRESRVFTKQTLQVAGVESLSNLAEFNDVGLMYEWLENGILAKNAVGGVGPLNSVKSSFILSPDPDAAWAKYLKDNPKRQKWDAKTGVNGIGILPAVAIPLIALISSAIALAGKFLDAAREKQSLAMANANGFGTSAYQSEKSDWAMPAASAGGGGFDTNTLLIVAAAAGGYFLLNDDK